MRPWNLVYMHIVGTFRRVWLMAPVEQICGALLAPNRLYRFSSIILKSLHWIHTKLYFVSVQKIYPRGLNFGVFLGIQMSQNSGFRQFCWKSYSGFTSILLYMVSGATYRDVYNMGRKAQFLGHFEPKVSKNSGHVLKKFSLISHQYCLICSLQVLSAVCGIWALEVQFWGHLGLQKSQNSGLWSFSQNVLTSLTSVSLHMFIASTFRCMVNMGLRGPNFSQFGHQK